MANRDFYTQDTQPVLTKKAQERFALPEKVGPYPIESLLSRGGMSLLYLARHPQEEFPVVVKVLSPEYASHPDMVAHFIRESEIIALTDHPNIIKLYGQGEWEKGLYIAMEFIQGIHLKQFITQQSLTLSSALDYVLQVAYALLHLHTHGVIHRDLKPENILITDQGQVKVIDFGIAQLVYDKTGPAREGLGQFLGTPSYMSPEQKKNPLDVTPATDIYALGVILYELITGRLSYGTIQLSLLPKGLRRIVKKCLEASLQDRYEDIVDFITDLTAYSKSDSYRDDHTSGHETKEVIAQILEAHLKLVPLNPPKLPSIDMGLAQAKKEMSLSLFYDFLRLSNGDLFLYFGDCHSPFVDALATVGYIKGMIHSLIHAYRQKFEAKFNLDTLIATLSETLADSRSTPFAAHFIHIRPGSDQFRLISCGTAPPLHINFAANAPRQLYSDNPLIGERTNASFSSITDSWTEGDTIIFHTFNTKFQKEREIPHLDKLLDEATIEFKHLTPQNQAESLFRRILHESSYSPETCPRAFLTLQRIT